MTDAENLLWSRLRRKQLKNLQFYRQRIIEDYIVDFYCPAAKLVIELDGGQHYTMEGRQKDQVRDAGLTALGLNVLRFSDRDIFENIQGVLESIWQNLE
jgi:very-short-patch-repair endonuclease